MTLPHDDSGSDGLNPETRERLLNLRREAEATGRTTRPVGKPDARTPDVERVLGEVSRYSAPLLRRDYLQLELPCDETHYYSARIDSDYFYRSVFC